MYWLWELLKFSIYGSIGFIFGACWKFTQDRNHRIDKALEEQFKDIDNQN
jgi:hypothetical protein